MLLNAFSHLLLPNVFPEVSHMRYFALCAFVSSLKLAELSLANVM